MADSAKIGRAKRRPGTAAYKLGQRWTINRDKRIAKDERDKALHVKKWLDPKRVKRGTMRLFRRMEERADKLAKQTITQATA